MMIDIGARIVMPLCRSATGVFGQNTYMIAMNKGMIMPQTASHRRIIALTGPDRIKFLQGLVSNDVSTLSDKAVYAALLTPQGKFMVDFFVIPQGDAMWIDVAAYEAPALLKRLTMYKMRSHVTLEMTNLAVSRGLGETSEGAFADPRHAALGWRAYDGRASEDVDWDALRVLYCVPETGVELTPDTYLLEAGFERLNGVDFRKGCYVGQEITARMKHKTELRKGLATVNITGTAPIGTPLKTEDGKEAGTLFTQSGGKAIAHLRFDRARGPMTAGDAQVTWDG
jgi:folate-binding protein YgfZ